MSFVSTYFTTSSLVSLWTFSVNFFGAGVVDDSGVAGGSGVVGVATISAIGVSAFLYFERTEAITSLILGESSFDFVFWSVYTKLVSSGLAT
jgi:hypothetical protein